MFRPHMSNHSQFRNQVTNVVGGLFALHDDLPGFKNHLRDFLVQLKEFSSQENEVITIYALYCVALLCG
jgi:hypothetical protein